MTRDQVREGVRRVSGVRMPAPEDMYVLALARSNRILKEAEMATWETVFEVVADSVLSGQGDGTHVYRFRTREAAEAFAASRTIYGRPCTVVTEEQVPHYLWARWVREGLV